MNEQDFYPPGGSSRGGIVASPDELPRYRSQSHLELVETGPIIRRSFTANFFEVMARVGARVTVTVADTWTPVVDITGKGYLGNVVASHGATGNKTVGIQIIRDGVQWEWEETFAAAEIQATLLLGAISPQSDQRQFLWPDEDRPTAAAGYADSLSAVLVDSSALLAMGAPVLGFEQSLQVNVKNSSTNSSQAGQWAACSYTLR